MTSKEFIEAYHLIESSILALEVGEGEARIRLEFANWMQPSFTGLEPVVVSAVIHFIGVTSSENTLPHTPIEKELIMDVNLTHPKETEDKQVLEFVTSSQDGFRIIAVQSSSVEFIKT